MDIVYVNRDGDNPELRYSLRTLKNVTHDNVWIFGGVPHWINTDAVYYRKRTQAGSAYRSVREHIAAACNTPQVSDPFLLWNDDFYAMDRVGDVPIMHRGSMDDMLEKFANLKTGWSKALIDTAHILSCYEVEDPVSYDLHVPLIVYKAEMRTALRIAGRAKSDAIHLRTIYGNIANLGGFEIEDPKLMKRSGPFPTGPWLSSGDDTFRSTVEPVLRYLFPEPSIYEKG